MESAVGLNTVCVSVKSLTDNIITFLDLFFFFFFSLTCFTVGPAVKSKGLRGQSLAAVACSDASLRVRMLGVHASISDSNKTAKRFYYYAGTGCDCAPFLTTWHCIPNTC